jgi:hypothetical protein
MSESNQDVIEAPSQYTYFEERHFDDVDAAGNSWKRNQKVTFTGDAATFDAIKTADSGNFSPHRERLNTPAHVGVTTARVV